MVFVATLPSTNLASQEVIANKISYYIGNFRKWKSGFIRLLEKIFYGNLPNLEMRKAGLAARPLDEIATSREHECTPDYVQSPIYLQYFAFGGNRMLSYPIDYQSTSDYIRYVVLAQHSCILVKFSLNIVLYSFKSPLFVSEVNYV